MKTYVHFWSYLAEFLLEWDMFHDGICIEKTHILCSVNFFQKSYCLWDNVEKYCRAGQVTDYSFAHVNCMLDN